MSLPPAEREEYNSVMAPGRKDRLWLPVAFQIPRCAHHLSRYYSMSQRICVSLLLLLEICLDSHYTKYALILQGIFLWTGGYAACCHYYSSVMNANYSLLIIIPSTTTEGSIIRMSILGSNIHED